MNCNTTLIVGFDCTGSYKEDRVYDYVTRYNTITGVPYQDKRWKETVITFNNVNEKFNAINCYDNYFRKLELNFFALPIMGIEVDTSSAYSKAVMQFDEINDIKCKVEKILNDLGWNLEVELFMFTDCD